MGLTISINIRYTLLNVTNFFNLFDDGQKAWLFSNIAEAMQGVREDIIERQLGHFEKVHPDYAEGVHKALPALAEASK